MPYRKCSFFVELNLIFHKSQLSNSSIKTLDKSILLQIFLQAFAVCQFIIAFYIVMSLFGWIVARIHLHIFDKMFLKRGSYDYLRSQD